MRSLPGYVKNDLRTLSKEDAETVGEHLAMAYRYLDSMPELAMEHATVARGFGARLGAVREIVGLAAYRTEQYDVAIRELRTAQRLTGAIDSLPIIADCLRATGKADRALEMLSSEDAPKLARAEQLELLIVGAGARMDLGQAAAAVVMLQVPELLGKNPEYFPRLVAAYADALEADGRADEAATWRAKIPENAEDAPVVEMDDVIMDLLDPVLDEEVTAAEAAKQESADDEANDGDAEPASERSDDDQSDAEDASDTGAADSEVTAESSGNEESADDESGTQETAAAESDSESAEPTRRASGEDEADAGPGDSADATTVAASPDTPEVAVSPPENATASSSDDADADAEVGTSGADAAADSTPTDVDVRDADAATDIRDDATDDASR